MPAAAAASPVAVLAQSFGGPVWKFGFNGDVSSSEEPIWDLGGAYSGLLSAATKIQVASASANDTSAGTGARTVRIIGVDANFAECYEDVTLTGQTAAPVAGTTQTFLRVHRAYCLTAGTGGTNAGNISVASNGDTFTAGVPAAGDTLARISTGEGQTLMAIYTVPAILGNGREVIGAYLRRMMVETVGNNALTVRLRVQNNGGALRSLDKAVIDNGQRIDRAYPDPAVFIPAGSAMYVSGTQATADAQVSAAFALSFRWRG